MAAAALVVLGAALSLVTTVAVLLLTEKFTRRRDREDRHERWSMENSRLQLDVLVELQDALAALHEAEETWRMQWFAFVGMQLRTKPGGGFELPEQGLGSSLLGAFHMAPYSTLGKHSAVERLWLRVEDDALRKFVTSLLAAYTAARKAMKDADPVKDLDRDVEGRQRAVTDRLGVLIRSMNKPEYLAPVR